MGVRVIAMDRPGYGESVFQRPSGLNQVVDSVLDLLNQKKISDFFVIGVSGGNPYAWKLAALAGPRVLGLASICGLAPFGLFPGTFSSLQRWGLSAARWLPTAALGSVCKRLFPLEVTEENLAFIAKRLHESDQKILQESEVKKMILQSMHQARKQGVPGIVNDLKIYSSKWEPDFETLRCPIHLWHGKKDWLLSPRMSIEMNRRIPASRLTLVDEEGHYSLPIKYTEKIVKDLILEKRSLGSLH